MKPLSKTKKILSWIVVIVIFYFIFRSIYSNIGQLEDFHWRFNYLYLIASFVGLALTMIFLVYIWYRIFSIFNIQLTFTQAFRFYFISNLGKYVPGKVWQLVGMAYLCKRENISSTTALTSAIVAQSLSVFSGLLISILLLKSLIFQFVGQELFWTVVGLMFSGLAVFSIKPIWYERVLEYIAKLAGKDIQFKIDMKPKYLLLFISLYTISWFTMGTSFFLLINSVYPLEWRYLIEIIGTYTSAVNLGFLFLLTPGGIGVREGIIALLFKSIGQTPTAISALIAIMSRIWILVVELALFFVAIILSRKKAKVSIKK